MNIRLGVILQETKLIQDIFSTNENITPSLTTSITRTPSLTPSITPTPSLVPPFQTTGTNTFNNTMQLLGLVLLLVFILIAAYYTTRFIGGIKMGQIKNSNFKVIETYKISQTKFLQIIQVGTKFILISINKDNVNFLMELEEQDIIQRSNNSYENINFKQILEKLKKQTH